MCVHTVLFSFNAPATTEIYTLSLHDALPISARPARSARVQCDPDAPDHRHAACGEGHPRVHVHLLDGGVRSEEHTSELQSQSNLVCRLLLEKKKKDDQATSL